MRGWGWVTTARMGPASSDGLDLEAAGPGQSLYFTARKAGTLGLAPHCPLVLVVLEVGVLEN